MTGCRIGRVKLKNGAEIVPFPKPSKDEMQTLLVQSAAKLSECSEPGELAGYVVFGWDFDGQWSLGFRLHEASPVGVTLFPSFVADALRRDLIRDGFWE